jgi:hypothetical protein
MKKFVVSIFIALQVITISAIGSSLACEDIFSQNFPIVASASIKGVAVLDALSRAELIQPFADPKTVNVSWQSFDALEKVKLLVEEYSAELKLMSPEQRSEERNQLLRLISQSPSLNTLFDSVAQSKKQDYLPTQYDLKRQLISKMIGIIKTLPTEFRPRVGKIGFDQRLKTINKDAAKFMEEQERRFDKVFETTGYKDYAEYEKTLRGSADPTVKRAIELIDQDKIEIIMRRPERGRFWIPKTGFQNQYISGSSQGYMDKAARYNVESTMTGRTKEEYWPLDDELKPKYATLRIAEDAGVINDMTGSHQYGSDRYVLRKSDLQNRLSFFPIDSLNNLYRLGPKWDSEVQVPLSWQWMLVPWSRRLLMVPFMIHGLGENRFGYPAAPQNIVLNWTNTGPGSYWESEIFGRVDLNIVETFEFEGNPPSGEFLKELRRRHIKIMDARMDHAQEWVEEEK